MDKTIKEEFERLLIEDSKMKYPSVPEYARVVNVPTINSANSLTKAIKLFIILNGDQCERVSTTGRWVDDSKVYQDVIGRNVVVGGGKYIKGSGTKGSADLHSTIRIKEYGVSVKWEVKWGKDTQKPHQKKYQQQVEKAGGLYYVVKTFEDFYQKYKRLKDGKAH
jgi:hypothetical protein